MSRFRNIVEDAKKFLGIPPYNDEVNTFKDSSDFAIDCVRTWGSDAFNEMVLNLRKEYSLES